MEGVSYLTDVPALPADYLPPGTAEQPKASTYQGWTNYATWNTYLWLTNAEDIYTYWVARAKVASHEPFPELYLADALKRDLEDLTARTMEDLHIVTPDGFVRGLLGDLLGWTVEQINFREIAKALLEEV